MDAARGTKQMEKYIFLSRNTSLPNVSSHTSLPDATETHYCCCCATQKCIALLREKPHRRNEALNDMFEVMKVFCCVLPLNLVLYHSPLCVFVRFALFSSVLQKKQQQKKKKLFVYDSFARGNDTVARSGAENCRATDWHHTKITSEPFLELLSLVRIQPSLEVEIHKQQPEPRIEAKGHALHWSHGVMLDYRAHTGHCRVRLAVWRLIILRKAPPDAARWDVKDYFWL